MKVTALTVLLGATVASAASSARVVLFDVPPRTPSTADVISPKIARFIFAQRLGLASDYSISGAEPAEVLQVDRYGGPQQYPLSGASPSGSRMMIVVDGVDKAETLISDDGLTSFDILPAPHPDDTKELMSELLTHSVHDISEFRPSEVKGLTELAARAGNTLRSHGDTVVMHVGSLLTPSKDDYGTEIARIRDFIHEIRKSDSFQTVTITLNPPAHQCSKRSSATKTFGGLLRKRTIVRTTEVPLISGDREIKVKVLKSQSQSDPAALPFSKHSNIPYKYKSVEACEKTTRNCTGHGECKALGGDDSSFFGCVCNKPAVKGSKTTYFGGSACQKKDLTIPFWLLAGTTIFLIAVVSAGIGLLYSIGSEELPSVIGAGVSAPRAK